MYILRYFSFMKFIHEIGRSMFLGLIVNMANIGSSELFRTGAYGISDYRARIISWRFCVNIFWKTMHLAQKTDHCYWIQEVQHLPLEPKIYIIAIISNIS